MSKTDPALRHDFPMVAIGASAGGLEAFESFFDQMPKPT
jgi:chemotaxis response regulator CheB